MGSKAAEYVSRTSIGAYFHSARESRKLVLVIVAIALLLDNMLLTTVGQYQLLYTAMLYACCLQFLSYRSFCITSATDMTISQLPQHDQR